MVGKPILHASHFRLVEEPEWQRQETKYGPRFCVTVCPGSSIIFLKQKSGSALRTGFPILIRRLHYCCVDCESGHDRGCTKYLKEVVYSRSTVTYHVARDSVYIRISCQESRKRVGNFRGKHSVSKCPLAEPIVAPSTGL